MANARGRGGTAQDAHAVLAATTDAASNTISYSTAGHPDPIVLMFPADRLGHQCREAVWAMIPHAQQGGRWAADGTLRRAPRTMTVLKEALDAAGIGGFDDPKLSFSHLMEVRDRIGEPWRSSRAAVAWVLRAYHPDGDRIAEQVLGDRLEMVPGSPTMAYDEATARTIEDAARQRFFARISRHRRALEQAGVDTTQPGWQFLTAEEVVAMAKSAGNPAAVSLARYTETGAIDGDAVDAVVSVDSSDLAAAMVLLTLAQNLGPNLAALQSMTSKAVLPVGAGAAVIDMTKSRALTSLRVASPNASLHTFGGLATALVGLTRFACARRAHTATTPQERRHAELLFVAEGHRTVLGTPAAAPWADALSREIGQRLSSRRLRETANIRGKRATGRGSVVGHSPQTNMVYLAEGMPEEELARLVVEAQDDIVARARRAVARDPEADAKRLAEVATTSPGQLVDRAVATCATAAIDPDTDQRCNRGILGCFTCPSGYRTDANIPGLKATVVLTNAIRAHDPDEWVNGPARVLHDYASAALDQFGPDHGAVEIGPVLAVVAALYNEVRG